MVKCKDCGFLAVVDIGSSKMEEAPIAMRRDDVLDLEKISRLTLLLPTCFVQKPHLEEALNSFDGGEAVSTIWQRRYRSETTLSAILPSRSAAMVR